ncbi:glycosyltransferase [Jiangella asiatica]|uniref:Glycosyltransferase n=1 Tax=Jiangella asiatica TaxID=2530372 RepID=A0A4V2Z4A8_9ACTN|nr:glycosyltransferase [Jiangella asiatica]TDE15888.1 glycosyltransferase [Jiangella asiatica]
MGPARADVAIISAGHDVADARLHKITAALVRRGLSVEIAGLGDAAAGPRDARVRAVQRGGMAGRALRAAALPWRVGARVLMTIDPDVIPMARAAGMVRRRKVVVDVHEDYARLLSDRSWASGLVGLGARVVVRTSTWLAAHADLTVVADGHIPPRTARRRIVVENLPDMGLLAPGPPEPEPRAVYIGDLRSSRGLFDMVETVALAPEWTLDLVGPVAAADHEALEERVQRADVAGRVRLHGRQPPEQAWQIARGAWAGLVFLHETPAFREAMPTKLYEYLASGLPVLSTPLPRQSAVVQESGGGLLVDGAVEAAEVLRRWARDPDELETYRKAARRWAERKLTENTPYDELADAVAELIKS